MLYLYVSLAYIIINSLLSLVVLVKSKHSIIGKFYGFCVASVIAFGLSAYYLDSSPTPYIHTIIIIVADFLFSLIPFFFLHFIVVFLRKYELATSKWVIIAIYFVGLFSYSIVLGGLIPEPISARSGSSSIESIYFITWMSVFFSIGIAILFSNVRSFTEKRTKSSILFTGLSILILVLPSPFTYSLSISFFQDKIEWYGVTSVLALIVSVYLLFRHKILVTLYDSVKSALLVMNDLFIMTDPTFHIQLTRGALNPMLGYEEKDLMGKDLNDFLADKEYIISYLEYVAKGKMKECRFDTDFFSKNGERVTVNFSFSPVIENEQIAGFVGIGRDITERKQAELELRQSREQYRELVENIRELFYVTDNVGNLTYTSPNIEQFTGYTPEELLHTSFYHIVDGKDRQRVLEFYAGKFKDSTIDTGYEIRVTRKDGKTIWLEQTTRIIRDAVGMPLEFRNIAHDITERKKADEQLHLFAQALETTTELIWISDQQNRIVHANRAFEQTFGYTHDEIYLKTPFFLFSPKKQDIVLAEIVSQKDEYGWSGEIACCKKDGTEFPSFLSVSMLRNDAGEVTGYIGVARDISEYKSMEEQFRQAQKLEGLGTLAGGIAHDFNNILTIILSYNSILARGKYTPDRMQEAVKMIRSAVERGAGMVRQLLTIARKNTGEFESVDINKIVIEMENLLKETFPKIITMKAELQYDIPEIVADQNQLQQVFLNLCVNARDSMPDGGSLTLKTKLVSGASLVDRFPDVKYDSYVQISVQDSGSGIDEAVRLKIFEPFFTTKQQGKGTGLGLAVVYSVIQTHNGMIDLESELGKGTTFHVFLPLIQDKSMQEQLPDDSENDQFIGNETILVVEDEEALLNYVRSELEVKGYTVLVARDGEEAIDVFSNNKKVINLVVSDLGLPKLGGWESYIRMKKIDPNINTILASGYIDSQLQSTMAEAGVKGVLNKPYDIGDLLEKIRGILDECKN